MKDPATTGESLLRIAGSMARLGGWAIDVPGDELYWSEQINRILEFPAGHVPELTQSLDVYPEPYRSQVIAALDACRADGTPFDLEVECVTRGGRRIWVRAVGEAERDESGRIVRVQGAFQDIDERVREERESEQLARRLTDLFESITDAVLALDREWRVTDMNRRAEELLERRRDDLVGRNIWDEFAPAVGGAFDQAYRRAVDTGERQVAVEHYEPLGRTFEARAFPHEHGLTIFFRDVTDEERLTAILEERQALLDRARDAIFTLDPDHRITYWNGGAEHVYGWSADEAVGRSARDLLFHDGDEFDALFESLVVAGEWSGDLRQPRNDGREVLVDSSWTLVRDASGEPTAVLAINTDVTERERIEQQFIRAQRLESLGTLAGGIAHDLNNVLAPTLMAVELLLADEDDADRRDTLEVVERSTRRGADMVRQVLSFARGVEAALGPIDVGGLLADVEGLIRETFPRNLAIAVIDRSGGAVVQGDRTQLEQVLVNLCVNARDAMPAGGALTVTAEVVEHDRADVERQPGARPGTYLALRVDDTGSGMSSEVRDKVFEPFFTTKEHGAGTGLGLSTVLAIVRSHGGFVDLTSDVGLGSSFTVHLPIDDSPSPTPAPAGDDAVAHDGSLVLVVDDEEGIRTITRRTLEAVGYRVVTAADGDEAVRVFADHPDVAVVLTDMMMPGMDGPDTVRALRAMRPDVPVVAATGLNVEGVADRAAEVGITTVIAKPYTAATVVAAVTEALGDR